MSGRVPGCPVGRRGVTIASWRSRMKRSMRAT